MVARKGYYGRRIWHHEVDEIMTEHTEQKVVIRLLYALSEEPLYVSTDDSSKSVGAVLREAVDKLEAIGQTHDAVQLSNTLKDHNLYLAGQQVSQDTPVSKLELENRELSGEQIRYCELQLLHEHRGG